MACAGHVDAGGALNVRNSNGERSNKDAEVNEGSRFWRILRLVVGCGVFKSKKEGSSNSNNIVQAKSKGKISKSGSTKSSPEDDSTKGSPVVLSEELIIASSLLRRFTFEDLKLATRNFKDENFLGEGGFGTVVKGWIGTFGNYATRPGVGIPVAIKSLNLNGLQGHKEWLAEISYLSELHHPNLVNLIGFCIEDDKKMLVYEFMARGSLDQHLFKAGTLFLPWPMRIKIMIGAAKGLAFLHEETARPVIFGDFKTSNILLDTNFHAKLLHFGLAKDAPVGDTSHVSTRLMGTQGYAAPEYVKTGHLTSKSDVYSFGVVLLEMLTGKKAIDMQRQKREQSMVHWVSSHMSEKVIRLSNLMDSRLEDRYSRTGAHRALRLATQCIGSDPKTRPKMSEVVQVLKSLPLNDEIAEGIERNIPRFIMFDHHNNLCSSPTHLVRFSTIVVNPITMFQNSLSYTFTPTTPMGTLPPQDPLNLP